MNVAVRYYTKSGNTKKLALAIADAVGVKAEDVSVSLDCKADVLFLGSSVYAAGVNESIKLFIKNNAENIGEIVNFSTAAVLDSTYSQVKKIARANHVKISSDEFHCRGSFAFMHRGKPDKNDLKKAAAFAENVCSKRQ